MAKPKRRPRNDPVLDRVLDDVLNEKVSVIPGIADLARRWREAPAEASDRKHPLQRTRDELVVEYFCMASFQPWAREGLDNLHRELLRTGEPIPDLLRVWNFCLATLGEPPSRPGRPRKIDRDVRASTIFKLLGYRSQGPTLGYTRDETIARIAGTMHIPEDTIRTIVRKHRTSLRS